MDESGAPVQALGQQPQQPPQPNGNSLGGLTQAPQQPQQPLSKDQTLAGLHHFSQIQEKFGPLLKLPSLGEKNVRPKIFDVAAILIGENVMTVPEVMTGIKDLPADPLGQKKWLERLVGTAAQAEQKLIQDYINQPPHQDAAEAPSAWSHDTHREHMTSLTSRFKK